MKEIVILLILFLPTETILGQSPVWLTKIESISLLKSTRDDAIKTFGQPEGKEPSQVENFLLDENRISVLYSNGKCTKKNEDGIQRIYGWQIPAWSVTKIDIDLKIPIDFEKLKIDLKNYKSYKESDNPTKHYFRDDLGIDYAFVKGKLVGVTFYPPDKLNYLACK